VCRYDIHPMQCRGAKSPKYGSVYQVLHYCPAPGFVGYSSVGNEETLHTFELQRAVCSEFIIFQQYTMRNKFI
jgi:hypothetical protein